MKIAFAAAAAAFTLACIPSLSQAHVTLENSTAKIGGGYKAVLRIPHGCNGQATHTVRVTIPNEIANVKPMPKAGWQLATKSGPYETAFNNHGKIMKEGVKEIAWSGGNLPDAYYDEFVFTGTIVPSASPKAVYIPVVQECADGAERWVEIPAVGDRAKSPAPRLQLVAGEMAHSAMSKEYTIGALKISSPWTRATPKGSKVGGGYLKITNTGKEADKLVGGTFPLAGKFEVHEMSMQGGMMKMRQLVDGLEIKPGQTVELKPGGYHLMFMQLKDSIVTGKPVKGTLVFQNAGSIEIEYVVAPIGSKEMPSGGGHMNH